MHAYNFIINLLASDEELTLYTKKENWLNNTINYIYSEFEKDLNPELAGTVVELCEKYFQLYFHRFIFKFYAEMSENQLDFLLNAYGQNNMREILAGLHELSTAQKQYQEHEIHSHVLAVILPAIIKLKAFQVQHEAKLRNFQQIETETHEELLLLDDESEESDSEPLNIVPFDRLYFKCEKIWADLHTCINYSKDSEDSDLIKKQLVISHEYLMQLLTGFTDNSLKELSAKIKTISDTLHCCYNLIHEILLHDSVVGANPIFNATQIALLMIFKDLASYEDIEQGTPTVLHGVPVKDYVAKGVLQEVLRAQTSADDYNARVDLSGLREWLSALGFEFQAYTTVNDLLLFLLQRIDFMQDVNPVSKSFYALATDIVQSTRAEERFAMLMHSNVSSSSSSCSTPLNPHEKKRKLNDASSSPEKKSCSVSKEKEADDSEDNEHMSPSFKS